MGFQVHRFCLSWGLLLVMLTCFSEGHFSEEYFHLKFIKDMLQPIKEKPGNTYGTGDYSGHGRPTTITTEEPGVEFWKIMAFPTRYYSGHGRRAPRSSTTSTTTTSTSRTWMFPTHDEPTTTTTTTTTTQEPGVEFRQIITFPSRYHSGHGRRAPRSSTTSTTTTSTSRTWMFPTHDEPTTTPTPTTTTEESGVDFRHFIDFPSRCPDNQVFVGGRCRLRINQSAHSD